MEEMEFIVKVEELEQGNRFSDWLILTRQVK
jgi:hypothetical protein